MAYRYLTDETNLPSEVIKLICEFTGPMEKWVRIKKYITIKGDLPYYMDECFIKHKPINQDEKRQLLKARTQTPEFMLCHIKRFTKSLRKIKNIEVENSERYTGRNMFKIYKFTKLSKIEEQVFWIIEESLKGKCNIVMFWG